MVSFKSTSFCLAIVLACFIMSASAGWKKRGLVDDKKKDKEEAPAWKPVTGTKTFNFQVDDNIHGANQDRQETWKDGTVTGSYAMPGRDGKWLKFNYIADEAGFRITSTKQMTADEISGGANPASDKEANVHIMKDDAPIQYTVTEEQLKKAQEQQKKQQRGTDEAALVW